MGGPDVVSRSERVVYVSMVARRRRPWRRMNRATSADATEARNTRWQVDTIGTDTGEAVRLKLTTFLTWFKERSGEEAEGVSQMGAGEEVEQQMAVGKATVWN